MRWLDNLPWWPLVAGAVLLGGAPFVPEPHLFEKLTMLAWGSLHRPIDIFDLVLHASLPLLLAVKLVRFGLGYRGRRDPSAGD